MSSLSFHASFHYVVSENSHNFAQVEVQNQVLVVHVSVIPASNFPRTKEVKQGTISSLIG